VCGRSGYPEGCAYTDKNNFAPRVGVVWSASKKTVVKVGGGMFYANNDANPLFRLAAGLPNNIAQTLSSNNFIPQYHNLNPFGANLVDRYRSRRPESISISGPATVCNGTFPCSVSWPGTRA